MECPAYLAGCVNKSNHCLVLNQFLIKIIFHSISLIFLILDLSKSSIFQNSLHSAWLNWGQSLLAPPRIMQLVTSVTFNVRKSSESFGVNWWKAACCCCGIVFIAQEISRFRRIFGFLLTYICIIYTATPSPPLGEHVGSSGEHWIDCQTYDKWLIHNCTTRNTP